MKYTILAALAISFVSGCSLTQQKQTAVKPKNIIMVVADGMGPAYTTAYRLYKDNPDTPLVEPTILDKYKVGAASTYPAQVSGYITDSSAAATALATGVKTYNQAVGIDVNKKPLETVMEYAKSIGKKTGIIVTSRVNHATPASYLAHNEYRRNYNQIADAYFDDKVNGNVKVDLIMGGGIQYFEREERNLVKDFKEAGFQYISEYNELASLEPNKPALALLAEQDIASALDHQDPHRLNTMTKKGLELLQNENGFFALIEASQVDWAGHDNDIATAMAEMDDLAKTMATLESFVAQNPDTLVVLTADHSTGGLTLGANKVYEWRPNYIKGLTQSPRSMVKKLQAAEKLTPVLAENIIGKTLTKEQYKRLVVVDKTKDYEVLKAVTAIFDQGSNTGWTGGGHTGVDVEVFAFGASSELFHGQQDNTDIGKKIFKLLGR